MSSDIIIHVVLDESGSMGPMAQDTVDGFNRFISDQKEQPGRAFVSLTKFNTVKTVVYSGIDIRNVRKLSVTANYNFRGLGQPVVRRPVNDYNTDSYCPDGGTALNDAVVAAIRATENDILRMENSPETVLVAIITDGEENSSVEFPAYKSVATLIDQKTKQGWTFVFLGADQDAWANSSRYGIPQVNTVNYRGVATASAYNSLSTATSGLRSGTVASASFGSAVQEVYDNETSS